MEQISYDRDNKKVEAVIEEEQGKKSAVAWNMLEHNTPRGIFPFYYFYMDNKVCFQYMTEGYTSVSAYFQRKKGNVETLHFLCEEIIAIMEEGQEYLLDTREFLLDAQWIFWNLKEKKIMLCYLPGRNGSGEKEYISLIEYLLQITDHQEKKAVSYIYGLYDYVKRDGFSIEGLQAFFASRSEEMQDSSPVSQDISLVQEKAEISKERENKREIFLVYDRKNNSQAFDKAGYPDEEFRYCLSGTKMTIGRGDFCDIILPFGFVSTNHAVISRQNDAFYLRDANSCNGVYLNGEKIASYEKKMLHAGDRVSFGGVLFLVTEKEQGLSGIPV